ncbi:MAG: hypothetical protein ACU85E_05790 [Gammaproteobacteria bacterium]
MKIMIRMLACFSMVAALSGCGLSNQQIVMTQAFGDATAAVGKLGEQEFVNIRNGIIEMNQELVAIDSTKTANSLIFDKPTFAGPTAKRVAASKALKLYGQLLVKLATEDRSRNLQRTARALLDNTTDALETDLSGDKKEAINKIIVGLGSFWLEKKKADAAKEIIPVYRQPVNDLADLLSEDFSLDDESLGYLKAYLTTAKRLKNASMKLVNAGDKYSVLERDRAVHAYVLAEMAITKSSVLSRKAKNSIAALKTANDELVNAIEGRDFSVDDIKSYAKQIQELVNIYDVLTN